MKKSLFLILLFLLCLQCGKPQNNQTEIDRLVAKYTAPREPAPYTWGQVIRFGKDGNSADYQNKGWGIPEKGFTWASGRGATLGLKIVKPTKPVDLTIKFFPFLIPGKIDRQVVKVFVNGEMVADLAIAKQGEQKEVITIPDKLLTQSNRLLITFDFPNATASDEVVYNGDRRVLSIAFCEIKLSESR